MLQSEILVETKLLTTVYVDAEAVLVVEEVIERERQSCQPVTKPLSV